MKWSARYGCVAPIKTSARAAICTRTRCSVSAPACEKFHPALELGRSFVRPEYQKNAIALLLLWKGIGQFVARHPRYRVLFGPVSISREYNTVSRDLMVSYLEARCGHQDLAALVEPRRKLRSRRLRACDTACSAPCFPASTSFPKWSPIEADGKGIPVLVRQYLKVGGEMLAFNVDAGFSST